MIYRKNLVLTDDDGLYCGTASFLDLLRAMTQLQIRSARYANPLTQLPGTVPINQMIDQLLIRGESFVVAYCDLDHFKPYNDVYGYAMGDDMIRALGHILSDVSGPTDFVGHIGGDDFIVIFRGSGWNERCERVLADFQQEITNFYSQDHLAQGGFQAEDREGNVVKFPLISLSVGVVLAEPFVFSSLKEISFIATEVKHQAKKIPGNSMFVDRRNSANEPDHKAVYYGA